MDLAKYTFLESGYVPLLRAMSRSATANWGKMNAQQMVEHVAAFFKVSTQKIVFPLSTPVEHLPKYKEFLMSDKEFRENTKAPAGIVPDEPYPEHFPDMASALDHLDAEIKYFFSYFNERPEQLTLHPAFGELNFSEWVLLHYKHVTHHLKQFGIRVDLTAASQI